MILAVLAMPLLLFQVGAADLDVYRHGASVLLHGASLYDPGFGAHLSSRLPFTYPPFAALAAVILLPLPGSIASWVWATATVAAFAWCVWISFRPLLERVRLPGEIVLAALIATLLYTRPVFDHLGDGQVDIVIMALCLADTVTSRPRWPRGALVGVATAIKLVPGIFIAYFWLTGRRRATGVAAGTFVLCELVAGLAAFGDFRLYWTHLVFDTSRPGDGAIYKNQSLRGIGLRLVPAIPGRGLLLVAAALVIAVVGLTRARHATSRGEVLAGATLTGLAGILASPVSWIHSTVWIIPAVGVILSRRPDRARLVIAGAITVALLAGLPYIPNVVHGVPHPAVLFLQSSFGLICVLLVLWLPASPGAGEERPVEEDAASTG